MSRRAADGLYHPQSEQELCALVKAAGELGFQLRVRGARHSVPGAFVTDPGVPGIDVSLDRYHGCTIRAGMAIVKAGTHLGADPADPRGTLKSSLLWQLSQHGLTLSSTGGITHQTVAGFTATGSAGGSTRHSVGEHLHAFRIIDGTGEPREYTRNDAEFYALAPNLGLLGVVSEITFACEPLFAIEGTETLVEAAGGAVEVPGSPSLEQFLKDTEYARVEWWPQPDVNRTVIWQARRIDAPKDFEPKPYRRFERFPVISQVLIAVLFAIIGNLGRLWDATKALHSAWDGVAARIGGAAPARWLGPVGRALAWLVSRLLAALTTLGILVLLPIARLIERHLQALFPRIVHVFLRVHSGRAPSVQEFRDWGWHGLPMDNAVDDRILPASFSEIWVPLPRTAELVQLLSVHFKGGLARTGTFVWELYGSPPSPFWLSPGYTSGDDEWRDGAFRVDSYWYEGNAGDPDKTLWLEVWECLRDSGLPFRLHWGKHLPAWPEVLSDQYPKWDDFKALRRAWDPHDIFLTGYWRERLGEPPARRTRR